MDDELWRVFESWNFWDKRFPKSIRRDVILDAEKFLNTQEALYFYGPRRAGKTFVCYQLMEALSKKHGQKSCLYINFEEPAFSGNLTTDFISLALDEAGKRLGNKPQYIFLDEVQNVPAWEKWVRATVDKREFKVFVTGSSAKLLSSEFSTSLGGRGIGFMVLPFSYSEFKVACPKATFEQYIKTGGYPAIVLEKNLERRTRLLEEYFETAITRDIASRYGVRDVPTLRTLAVYVLTNFGKRFSYNKLRAMTGLSFDAIRDYLSYLEGAFIIFQAPQFSYSLRKAMQEPRKYYAYDLGLAAAVSKSYSPDTGRLVENAVAIELVRRGAEVQYYSNDYEVDFIVKEGIKPTAINVTYSDNPVEREFLGLEKFKKQHRGAKTLLLDKTNLEKWFYSN